MRLRTPGIESVVSSMVFVVLLGCLTVAESGYIPGLEELKLEELDCSRSDGTFCPSWESAPLGAWCPRGFQCESGNIEPCGKGKDSKGAYDTCSWTTIMIAAFVFCGLFGLFLCAACGAAATDNGEAAGSAAALACAFFIPFVILISVGMEGFNAPGQCPEIAGKFCPSGSTRSRECPSGHYCPGDGQARPCCDSEVFPSAPKCQSLCGQGEFAVSQCTPTSDHTCVEQNPEGGQFEIDCIKYTSSCSDLRNVEYCALFARAAEFRQDERWTCEEQACKDADAIRQTSFDLYILNFCDMIMNLAVLIPATFNALIRGLPEAAPGQWGVPGWANTAPVLRALIAFQVFMQLAEAALGAWEVHIVRTAIPDAFDRFRAQNCIQRDSDFIVLDLASTLQTLSLLAPIQLAISIGEIFEGIHAMYLESEIDEIDEQEGEDSSITQMTDEIIARMNKREKHQDKSKRTLLYVMTIGAVGTIALTSASVMDFVVFTTDLRRSVERLYAVQGGEDGESVWCLRSEVADSDGCDATILDNPEGAGTVSAALRLGVALGCLIGPMLLLCGCLRLFKSEGQKAEEKKKTAERIRDSRSKHGTPSSTKTRSQPATITNSDLVLEDTARQPSASMMYSPPGTLTATPSGGSGVQQPMVPTLMAFPGSA